MKREILLTDIPTDRPTDIGTIMAQYTYTVRYTDAIQFLVHG